MKRRLVPIKGVRTAPRFAGNACKSQLYFVEILETSLWFCAKTVMEMQLTSSGKLTDATVLGSRELQTPPLEKPPKIRNPPENKEGEREIILTRAITGAFYSL